MTSLLSGARQLRERRSLVRFLARKRRRTGIAGTILGRLWFLITPTAQILIYYVLVVVIFGQGDSYRGGAFLTIVAGITHYIAFSQATTSGAGSILAQERLLLQVRIEPMIFVGASYRAALADAVVAMAVFFGFYFLMGDPSTAIWLAYLAALVLLALLTWTMALLTATLSVFLRDIRLGLPIALRLMLYAGPVIYPVEFVPERLQTLYFLNPVAVVFGSIQYSLFGGAAPPAISIISSTAFLVLAAVGTHVLYARLEPRFTKAF